jgi:hypothetical protein
MNRDEDESTPHKDDLTLDLFADAQQPPTDQPLLNRCTNACDYIRHPYTGKTQCRRCYHEHVR